MRQALLTLLCLVLCGSLPVRTNAQTPTKCSYTRDGLTFENYNQVCRYVLSRHTPPEGFKSATPTDVPHQMHCVGANGFEMDIDVECASSSQPAGSEPEKTSPPQTPSCPVVAGQQAKSPGKAAAQSSQTKALRMPESRAQCFSIDGFNSNAQLKEFAAQLRRQQDALNQMTVGDFISGMSWYAEKRQEGARVPRKGQGAKQEAMREKYRSTVKASMVKSMQCGGMSKAQAEAKAEAKVPQVMSRLHALHEPDIALTGSEVTRLGDAQVNSAIGQQWAEMPGGRYSDDSRRYRLLADVMQAQSSLGDTALLNVVLEPCRR